MIAGTISLTKKMNRPVHFEIHAADPAKRMQRARTRYHGGCVMRMGAGAAAGSHQADQSAK